MRTTHSPWLGLTLLAVLASPAAALDALPHALAPDPTPTYDGSGQVVEPDVLYVPGGWHGYAYWMAMTPYTCGDETSENPSVLASQDGRNWVVPMAGFESAPTPIVPGPSSCYPYLWNNNDPSIVLAGDSLFIYYAVTHYFGLKGGTTEVRRVGSADGVHWTLADNAPLLWTRPNYLLSPSVVYNAGSWYAWYVQMPSCDAHQADLHRRRSTDGLSWPDSTDEVVSIDGIHGLVFHLTVKFVGDTYAMLYIAFPKDSTCRSLDGLYYAESDDGTNWTSLAQPMLTPTFAPGAWDGQRIYRSTFTGRYPNMSVWYSAHGDEACKFCQAAFTGRTWHVGFASISNALAPAAFGMDTSAVRFGAVIQGAPNPSQRRLIAHLQRVPADELTYTVSTSPGFEVVPSGNFTLSSGGTNTHDLEMDTETPGAKLGSLAVTSNAPDDPRAAVRLSGAVLRHAAPSLEPLAPAAADTLDLGRHGAGRFSPRTTRVFNLGYDGLQARLSLKAAAIAGGDGRFSIVGGFQPALVTAAGPPLAVRFDDDGATPDSTYSATLTLRSADEPLPGASPMPDLTVTLTARLAGDPDRWPGSRGVPAATRLYPPFPNPLTGSSTVRFDLARADRVALEIFDLSGRRVATLVHRDFDPGQFGVTWDGRLDGESSARAGLYFVRLGGGTLRPQTERLIVVR